MLNRNNQAIASVKEDFVRRQAQIDEVDKVESRLGSKIKEVKDDLKSDIREVKDDLHNRISRLETRLQWSMGIAVAVLAIVVPLLVKFLSA